ncbi:lipopolysaccharide biosynthesis protein [Cognatilysobacter terrigena]|uniref:lipopolysaccharide biosynthesis protein n=1 Tax=Cognatilysobacter terrigena TaxID=2488749 RepID=UPI00105C27C7|nr:oligosaccharide flippase family protein [Lysobacter terrigena]
MTSRLRHNVLASIAGTGIAAVASVLSAPLIYRELGADAYGLVGFHLLLQGLLPLFDAGITAGLARATAWHHGRGGLGEIRTLIGVARRPITALAAMLFVAFLALARPIALRWLGPAQLDAGTTHAVLILIAAALALRMPMLLDRAALAALERQVAVNVIQGMAAVARTLGALAAAVMTDTGVVGFFAMQPVVSLAEMVGYRIVLERVLHVPASPLERAELNTQVRFSLALAGLSALWLASSQLDRFVLSSVLALKDYGAYSLGVHMASAVTLTVGALQTAIQPRLTRLVSSGDEDHLRALYGLGTALSVSLGTTALVAIIAGGALLIPSVRAATIDPVWIAAMYGVGNIAVAIMAQAYQLQNARGQLGLHAKVTASQALIQAPLLAVAAAVWGARAAAVVYAAANMAFALLWLPVIHRHFLAARQARWFATDCLRPLLGGLACVVAASWLATYGAPGRLAAFLIVGTLVLTTLLVTSLSHAGAREELRRWWSREHVA